MVSAVTPIKWGRGGPGPPRPVTLGPVPRTRQRPAKSCHITTQARPSPGQARGKHCFKTYMLKDSNRPLPLCFSNMRLLSSLWVVLLLLLLPRPGLAVNQATFRPVYADNHRYNGTGVLEVSPEDSPTICCIRCHRHSDCDTVQVRTLRRCHVETAHQTWDQYYS